MRSIVIMLAIATSLLAIGCGDEERLQNELATANTQIGMLDSTLSETRAALTESARRADSLSRTLRLTEAANDSLNGSLKSAVKRAGRLEADLHASRTRFQNTLDSLQGVNAMIEEQVDRLEAQMQNAEVQIATLQQRADELAGERDSVYAFVDNIRPWYDYYKHEARRNWLKKLVGAGDAKKPQTSEPAFQSTTPDVDLEAQRP